MIIGFIDFFLFFDCCHNREQPPDLLIDGRRGGSGEDGQTAALLGGQVLAFKRLKKSA
jgi:hypothetical protein